MVKVKKDMFVCGLILINNTRFFSRLPLLKFSEKLAARWDTASSKEEHIPLYEESMSFTIQLILTTLYGKLYERHEDFVEIKSLYDYVSKRTMSK